MRPVDTEFSPMGKSLATRRSPFAAVIAVFCVIASLLSMSSLRADITRAESDPVSLEQAATAERPHDGRDRQVLLLGSFSTLLIIVLMVALARSNAQLRSTRQALAGNRDSLFDALSDLVWQKDLHGHYVNCNAAFAKFFERQPADIVGKRDADLVNLDVARRWRKEERLAMHAGRPVESEEWINSAGKSRSMLLSISRMPVYDDGDQLIGVISVGRDIGERHRAESELRQRESYQRALLDNFPFLIWLKDAESRFLAVNRLFAKATGAKQPEELVGKTDLDIWPQDLAEQYRADDRHVMTTRRPKDVEEAVDVDGERKWFETYKMPVLDANGRLLGTVGFARDISERKRMSEIIADSEQRFRSLFEHNSSVMLLVDGENGRIIEANAAAARFYGYPIEMLAEMTVADLNVLNQDQVTAARQRALHERQNLFHFRHRLASGDQRDVDVYSTPISHNGKALLFSIIHDVTDQRIAGQALRDSEARFRRFFDKNSAMMLLVDPTGGTIVDANAAAIAFYGYPGNGLIGQTVDRINTLDAGQLQAVRQEICSGERTHFEFTHRLANGLERDVDVYASAIEQNSRTLILAIVHDATERKQARRALQQERDLFSSGPVVVFTWLAEEGWPVAAVSSNVSHVLGYPAESLTAKGFRFHDLIHADDRERLEAEVAENWKRGVDQFEQSYRLRHQSGHYHWYHDFTRLLRNDAGEVIEIRGYLFDESKTKTLAISLAEEQERLKQVIDATSTGIWQWNPQTDELLINERWAEITGFTIDELGPLGFETWSGALHPEDAEAARQQLQQHLAGKTAFFDCEVRMRHRGGHWVWVCSRGQILERSSDGRPRLMYGTHQDITERKNAEFALRETEQRLRTAGRVAYDLIYEWHVVSGHLEWFGDIDSVLGFPAGSISRDVDDWLSRIHPDDQSKMVDTLARHAESSEPIAEEYRIRAADGSYRVWQDKALPVVDEDGKPLKWVGVCSDITERRRSEEQLRLAGTVFQFAQEAIVITDADARIVDVNDAFSDITGYPKAEALGRNPSFLSSGRQDGEFYRQMWRELRQKRSWRGEIWNRRKNGEVYAELLAISGVLNAAGEVQNYVALFSDITALKEQQSQLEHIAYYDPLTKMPNRLLFGDRLNQAMARARRQKRWLAVVFLDLDGFKDINDRCGHDVGDRVLVDIATRLSQTLRQEDTLSRLGGDEFAAVMVDLADSGSCVDLLPRLLSVARQPLKIGKHDLQVSASIGVTLYPQADDVDADQLLRQADQAMYQAKVAGKNRYHFFDAEQDRNIRGQVEILEQIDRALTEDEFSLHYQPKVNMRTGEILGAEALIRWPLSHGGLRLPGEFLPYVENHPLAMKLDKWVFDHAMRQLSSWRQKGQNYSISVNVSAYQLQQARFIEQLRVQLQEFPDVDPGNLVIEVLETTALMDLSRVSAVIHAGQSMGVQFALDDFGTGYSSLNYLKNLPAKQLKIDRSFVRDMLDDRDDLAILEGIMGLATAFSRTAVAEGVETVEHGEILLQLGCEIGQGFGIGRPMPASQFATWAEAWRPDPLWLNRRPVERDDLPLVFAMVEHRAWMRALESQLYGEKLALPPLDERLCRFGKWLNSDASLHSSFPKALEPIVRLHQRIHATAPQVLALHRRGDTLATQEKLAELHGVSRQLQERLRILLRTR